MPWYDLWFANGYRANFWIFIGYCAYFLVFIPRKQDTIICQTLFPTFVLRINVFQRCGIHKFSLLLLTIQIAFRIFRYHFTINSSSWKKDLHSENIVAKLQGWVLENYNVPFSKNYMLSFDSLFKPECWKPEGFLI